MKNVKDLYALCIEYNFNVKEMAAAKKVSYYTMLNWLHPIYESFTIDDVLTLSHQISDIKRVVTPKSTVYNQILEITSFLPTKTGIRERLYYIKHNTHTPPTCPICGGVLKWDNTKQSFRTFCSVKCGSSSILTQQKRKETNISKLGVAYPAQSTDVRNKYKQTMLDRYGVSHVGQTQNSISCTEELIRDLYVSQHLSTFDIASRCNVSQSFVSNLLRQYNIEPHAKSCFEQQVIDFLRIDLNLDLELNSRKIIPPKELDIFIPSHNLAIECNGLYWHTEISGNKNKFYHNDKTLACASQQIRLIHIFESEWINFIDIVKSRLQSITRNNLTIYGRKCTIQEVSAHQAKLFYDTNHIQRGMWSKYNLGLFYSTELVACMSFSKPRYNKTHDIELTRYCSKLGYNIVGGASKLFSAFIRDYPNINSIISYSDRRWNTGKLYQTLGFSSCPSSPPNYFYVKHPTTELLSRVKYQKHKLEAILPIYDPDLSEWVNMKSNGYDRIWDCGSDVWSLVLKRDVQVK